MPLPTGPITFLCTNIEDSARLWEMHQQAMSAALVRHNTILHIAIAKNNGIVFKTTDYGFRIVFMTAIDAIQAALAGQRALLVEPWPAEIGQLRVRMGIHTGMDESRNDDYFGLLSDQTSHIEYAGHGGQILISQATQTLIQDRLPDGVALIEMGQYLFRNLLAPKTVCQLSAPDLLTDFPPLKSLAFKPANLPSFLKEQPESATTTTVAFVSREPELLRLNDYLDKALEGHGGLVFVKGEAGIGKTTLMEEFARQAQEARPDLVSVFGTCDVHTGVGAPYLPFRDCLAMLSGEAESSWRSGRITLDHAHRLWHMLPHTIQALMERGPELIDTLLSRRALTDRLAAYATGQASNLKNLQDLAEGLFRNMEKPRSSQSRLFQAYLDVLLELSASHPLLLILDDLQWVDLSSIGLLSHISSRLEGVRLLIVGTYRPEDVFKGRDGKQHPFEEVLNEFQRRFGDITIDLDSARTNRGRAFVDALLDSESNQLDEIFRHDLTQLTGGHPLFTIELLRDLQEQGLLRKDEAGKWFTETELSWDRLPARVEGVIGRRIDRLDDELRHILLIASTEGERFTAEVIARYLGTNISTLISRLSRQLDQQHRLIEVHGIRTVDSQRLSRYKFRHNLFQKYLYSRLDEIERVHLHEVVGQTLEGLYQMQLESIVPELARHFQIAGQLDKAIHYLQMAGEQAARNYATHEAISFYKDALQTLYRLPDSSVRAERELRIQINIGNLMISSRGYGSAEMWRAYNRALELSYKVEKIPSELLPLIFGLYTYSYVAVKFQKARKYGAEFMNIAHGQKDPALVMIGHRLLMGPLWSMGEFRAAQNHLEAILSIYDRREHYTLVHTYGQDTGVVALGYLALSQWMVGLADQALKQAKKALNLAIQIKHPLTLCFAHWVVAMVHRYRGEKQAVKLHIASCLALATEQKYSFYMAIATIEQAKILVDEGEDAIGLVQIHQGYDNYLATGSKLLRPTLLLLLVEAHTKTGEIEAALSIVDDALRVISESGERHWEAEFHRLKGDLVYRLATEGKVTDSAPEDHFQRAIAVARHQTTKSIELKATIGLSRVWQRQGRQAEAYHTLAKIYDWFSEGFDTADLTQAKILLNTLAGKA